MWLKKRQGLAQNINVNNALYKYLSKISYVVKLTDKNLMNWKKAAFKCHQTLLPYTKCGLA
jgi:hypothetical protein